MNSYDPEDQSMSMSGYAYCGNNPVMGTDPSGLLFGIDDVAVGLVGGIFNLAFNIGKSESIWQSLGYFGTGFVSGVVATHPEFGGPLLAGALLGAGNAALQGGDLKQVALGAATGAATSWAGGQLNNVISPLTSQIGTNITSPILKNTIQQAIGGAIVGGAVGSVFKGAMNSFNGESFWTGFGEGLTQGATAGAIGGAVSGTFKGVNEAKTAGVNPWTGRTVGIRQYNPNVNMGSIPSNVVLSKGSQEGIEIMQVKGNRTGYKNSVDQYDVNNHTIDEVWNFLADPRSGANPMTHPSGAGSFSNNYLQLSRYISHDNYPTISFTVPGGARPFLKLRWTK